MDGDGERSPPGGRQREAWLSRRRVLRTAGAGTATLGTTGIATGDGEDATGSDRGIPTPRLDVDGRWLEDPVGRRIVLRGANVTDPYWGMVNADWRGKDTREVLEVATDPKQGWYPRVIRLPCLPESIAEIGLETFYEDHLRPAVEFCGRAGVYCIVDYHAIERYDTDGIDRRLRDFWAFVAPKLADEAHVCFELFNEPTEPYGDGRASWEQWRTVAQPWVDHVREHAPETPIVIGSPRWTSLAMHAADAPFEGDNLCYSVHHYPGHPESRLAGYAEAAESVPLLVTEWGYIDNPDKPEHMVGTTSEFGESFREWLESVPNVGWLAWCFDAVWDPKMFDSDWDLRGGEEYMGELVKDALAETRDEWRLDAVRPAIEPATLQSLSKLVGRDLEELYRLLLGP